VDELADALRDVVPAYWPSDEVAVRLLALALARLERAEAVADPSSKLRTDTLGWANSARRLLGDLGLTPTSRAALGLDVARTTAIVRPDLDGHPPAVRAAIARALIDAQQADG
jgi:hypothetical protein